jgi:hypothetical protein
MNKLIIATIIMAFLPTFFSSPKVSSLAVVTLVGAHIKCKDTPVNIKYNRKDCPVCEGKGWYISGDGIKKVDCGYCEEKSLQTLHE